MTNEELQAIANLLDVKLQPINDRLDKLEQGQADIKQVQLNSIVSDNEVKNKVGIVLDGIKGIQDRFDRQDKAEEK